MSDKKQDTLYLLILLGYLAAHYYLIWHIDAGLHPVPILNTILIFLVFGMGFISILSVISIKFPSRFVNWAHGPGNLWMGIFGITVICFAVNDLVNVIFKPDIENFRFYSTLTALVVDMIFCVWAALNAAFILRVKKVHLGVPGFKADKFRVAFFSDIHINKHTPFKNINKIVDKINKIKPDVIIIGGDLADTDITETYPLYGFDRLQAKYGIFAVTGNHEYHLGIETFLKFCDELNIKVLRNESVNIEGIVTISGINDDFGEKIGVDTSDLKKALGEIDTSIPLILVSHKPDPFKDAVKEGKGMRLIQLSGHTHAGQIPPMGIIGSMFFKYYYGRRKKDESMVYITSGAGWWGPPMRLFNMSEIAEVILYKKRK